MMTVARARVLLPLAARMLSYWEQTECTLGDALAVVTLEHPEVILTADDEAFLILLVVRASTGLL